VCVGARLVSTDKIHLQTGDRPVKCDVAALQNAVSVAVSIALVDIIT